MLGACRWCSEASALKAILWLVLLGSQGAAGFGALLTLQALTACAASRA